MLKDIEEALEKSTPGKWYVLQTEVFVETGPICKLWGDGIRGEFRFDNYENNGYLIANAPTWLRHLLSIISQKDEEIESYKATVSEALNALERAADLGSTGEDARWMHEDIDYAISELKKLEVESPC